MALGDFHGAVKAGLRQRFMDVGGRKNKRELYSLVSNGAGYTLRDQLKGKPEPIKHYSQLVADSR